MCTDAASAGSQPLCVLIVMATNQRRGAEVQAVGLAAALGEAGVKASTLALQDRSGTVTVLDVAVLGAQPFSARGLRSLRRQISANQVVVAFGSRSLPAVALSGIGGGVPFVYASIGDPARWVRGRVHRARTGLLMRRAAHVVALWPGAKASIEQLYQVPTDRVSVIPNARSSAPLAEPRRVGPGSAPGTHVSAAAATRVVVVVGALSHEKRVDLAIDTIARDGSVRLVVAGDGPLRADLERHAGRVAPGRVQFLGSVDEVAEVYLAADAVLMTSRTEGMPGVAIEAGLASLPVVTTDVGAVREVVVDGVTGRVVSGEDPADLHAALIDCLANGAAMGQAARRHCVAEFGWASVGRRWLEVLMNVTALSTRGSP
jgi:glycosyltransferase involved in cell wall biosynthesis